MAEYNKREIIQTTAFPPKYLVTGRPDAPLKVEQLELFEKYERGHGSGPSKEAVGGFLLKDAMRKFPSGATRNVDEDKLDFEGFLSPMVQRRFAEYMHVHRKQADGALRDSDNWQKGIPKTAYMKSGTRHHHEWWSLHRGYTPLEPTTIEDAICALLFNAQGYLHELLKERAYGKQGS